MPEFRKPRSYLQGGNTVTALAFNTSVADNVQAVREFVRTRSVFFARYTTWEDLLFDWDGLTTEWDFVDSQFQSNGAFWVPWAALRPVQTPAATGGKRQFRFVFAYTYWYPTLDTLVDDREVKFYVRHVIDGNGGSQNGSWVEIPQGTVTVTPDPYQVDVVVRDSGWVDMGASLNTSWFTGYKLKMTQRLVNGPNSDYLDDSVSPLFVLVEARVT